MFRLLICKQPWRAPSSNHINGVSHLGGNRDVKPLVARHGPGCVATRKPLQMVKGFKMCLAEEDESLDPPGYPSADDISCMTACRYAEDVIKLFKCSLPVGVCVS